MKKCLFFFLLVPIIAYTQALKADFSTLDFGNVFVDNKDSLKIRIKNTSGDSIFINAFKFYSYYDEFPFSSSKNSLNIAPNGVDSAWIYFSPKQNMWHNSELIIQHNASSGPLFIDLKGQGRFPFTYYDTTENLTEEALKKALNYRLGKGFKQLSYNAARDEMYHKIDNQNASLPGKVEGVYTGTVKTYTNRSNVQTTSPQFNTEHTFPQGFFNSVLPERSDIHHLFPTTNKANSERGNKVFGKVNGGTASGGGSFFNNNTYEPRDAQKGRTARAMMYFVLRYQDYSNHFSTQESTLRDWHNDFLPDSIEKERNEGIFNAQKNRNPFIDYPQLEKRISKFVSNSIAPIVWELDLPQVSIDYDTVFTQTPDTFNFVVVNTGNRRVDFSNFSLSDTSILSFANASGMDTSILPGDLIPISMVLTSNSSGSINEQLTFSTNLPGSGANYTIPVSANAKMLVALPENRLEEEIHVFPNPFRNYIRVLINSDRASTIRLLDLMGRSVSFTSLNQGDQITISTAHLKRGIYFLELGIGNQRIIRQLIK